ncbi:MULTISPECIES: hypothetical protein [unclassified Streptomyces]|uniref:hypothetical protein n=1 Tax=unclassified Streptomyces TaxID=2593676 RepID=UPI002E27C713|nr:hypothetical protein [Streptomyces sp. NBC_00273]
MPDAGGEVLRAGPFAWLPGELFPVVGAGAGGALAAGAELLVVATKMLAAMPARGTTIPATHQAQRGGPERGGSAGTVGA